MVKKLDPHPTHPTLPCPTPRVHSLPLYAAWAHAEVKVGGAGKLRSADCVAEGRVQVVVINKKDFMDLDNPLLAWMLDSDAVTTVLRVPVCSPQHNSHLDPPMKSFIHFTVRVLSHSCL